MDMLGAALTMICVLSERRLNRLNNPALNSNLPPFLTKGAGMFSGMMLSQYTADTLIVEQKMLSAPASIQSIPAAADQEDFVSMGMNTAIKNFQILENANVKVTVVGKFCESGDILSDESYLPEMNYGDLIVATTSGAYNIAMSSNYNMYCRPTILMVNKGKHRVIKRKETYEDLLSYFV